MEKRVVRHAAKPVMAKRKRTAAYARVSTGKDAMLHSLAEQATYYNELIRKRPDWVFAGVYADEAYTGTKEDRPEFLRLLADCREGKVDQIITKSVSRFARNTVTTLQTVRELKALGVDVFFENENINSMSGEGELMLTILSAFAQEESRSASENMKLRIRNSFKNGELMCWRVLFGYRISRGGVEIDPEEGPVIQEAFMRVACGDSLLSVVRWMNRTGHTGALGGKWTVTNLRTTMANEKYTGNAWLQKTFVNNHLEKKKLRNTGEVAKYYATETHPALIDQETFDAVQRRLAEIAEKHKKRAKAKTSAFTGKIRCPNCGKYFRRTLKNGSPGWICPTYYDEGKGACRSKKIPEETLKRILPEGWLEIVASGPNTLEIHMTDGSVRTLEWEDRSRRESWTAEMKEKARQDGRRRKRG